MAMHRSFLETGPPADARPGVGSVTMPPAMTSFGGRDRELTAIRQLLRDPAIRLLTLTGAGGVGKTRLALQVAETVADTFAGGVWVVPLAPVRDPALVPSAIALALSVPQTSRSVLIEAIRERVSAAPSLLVLDNVEHVIAAAPRLAELLAVCPALTCMVTSRVLLQLTGEHVFPVPPLALPPATTGVTAAHIARSPAVQLFVSRARAVRADVTLTDANAAAVDAICRRLDGVPLAIELAAARVRHLEVAELRARLHAPASGALSVLTGGPLDAPARQRTMRDAIAWSYALLTATEQAVLRRVAVFVGGFPRAAVMAVGRGAGLNEPAIEAALDALVDHSLLQTQPATDGTRRYTILETVREFGLEQLHAHDDLVPCQTDHAAWCVELSERAARNYEGPTQGLWLDRLDEERANLSTALKWLCKSDECELAHRFGAALWRFWLDRCHYLEGRMHLEEILACPATENPTVTAEVMIGLGAITNTLGDYVVALRLHQSAVAMQREYGRTEALARALWQLGLTTLNRDLEQAEAAYRESLEIFRAVGHELGVAGCLWGLGQVCRRHGDRQGALHRFSEGLRLARQLANPQVLASLLRVYGEVTRELGDLRRAAEMFSEALSLYAQLGEWWGGTTCLDDLAAIAAHAGQPGRATRLFGASSALRKDISLSPSNVDSSLFRRILAELQITLGDSDFITAWVEGQALEIEQVIVEAANVESNISDALHKQSAGAGPVLTEREQEVLALIVTGSTDRDIGEVLFISHRTVNKHVGSILAKLGVASRAEAATYALQHGLQSSPLSLRSY